MIDTRVPCSVSEFSIEDFQPGTKTRVDLVVDQLPDGQPLVFSTVIARGDRPGKIFLATGGVHGDEYEGPVAIQDFFSELETESFGGSFVAIPILNSPAFLAGTREGGWDRQNLARIFPGRDVGTVSERIAHAFSSYILPQVDFYADLHSGGIIHRIKRFAGYQIRSGELNRVQREAAIAFGLDLVWGTTPQPGRTLSAAADRGVPAIYVEMTGEGRCRVEDLKQTKLGLRNLMAYLEMSSAPFPSTPPQHCFESTGDEAGHLQIDHLSPSSGIFISRVTVWDYVEQGQLLGHVRHPDGSVVADVPSHRAGRVLFLRTLPRVFAGDPLAYVLSLPGE